MYKSVSKKDKFTIVEVSGDVDRGEDCTLVSNEVNKLIDGDCSHIVIDMSHTNFVSSSFCGMMSLILKRANESKTRLSLIIPHNSVTYEIFEITGITDFLEIHHSLEAFYASMEGSA
jgi:anti-anti-sigma factor